MSLFLSKLLPIFVYPVGLTCVLLGVGIVALVFRRQRAGIAFCVLALCVLWISSTPIFGRLVYWQLESRYPPIAAGALAQADVAIVLGGSLAPYRSAARLPELDDAIDRVWYAARLYKAGTVGAILITGGNLPWNRTVRPEAHLVADLLVELGVPRSALILEDQSRNTFENAMFSKPIWDEAGYSSGYLVTSAAHMIRALAVFAKAGYPLAAAATDYQISLPLADSSLVFLPSHGGLDLTSRAVKEVLGLAIYRLRGWI